MGVSKQVTKIIEGNIIFVGVPDLLYSHIESWMVHGNNPWNSTQIEKRFANRS